MTGLSASALLLASGCGRHSPGSIRIGTTEGLNLTMTQLLRQQGFFKSFDVDADVIALADG